MDESRVRGRLARIGALDRASAAPGELLAELRILLSEAERLARERASAARSGEEVVERPAGRLLGT
jgi:hypothetical protein